MGPQTGVVFSSGARPLCGVPERGGRGDDGAVGGGGAEGGGAAGVPPTLRRFEAPRQAGGGAAQESVVSLRVGLPLCAQQGLFPLMQTVS